MRNSFRKVQLGAGLLAILVSAAVAEAQAPQSGPAREAADAYLAYVQVVEKATTFDEVLPHLSREALAMIGELPGPEEATEMLEMIQLFMPRDIAVVAARVHDAQVELSASGTRDEATATGTIDMVREDGEWKVSREQWEVKHTVG